MPEQRALFIPVMEPQFYFSLLRPAPNWCSATRLSEWVPINIDRRVVVRNLILVPRAPAGREKNEKELQSNKEKVGGEVVFLVSGGATLLSLAIDFYFLVFRRPPGDS